MYGQYNGSALEGNPWPAAESKERARRTRNAWLLIILIVAFLDFWLVWYQLKFNHEQPGKVEAMLQAFSFSQYQNMVVQDVGLAMMRAAHFDSTLLAWLGKYKQIWRPLASFMTNYG